MTDPQDFEWPWPTLLTDEEVEKVRDDFQAAAAIAKQNVDDQRTDYIASFAQSAALFVQEYLDGRRAGVPELQRIDPDQLGG